MILTNQQKYIVEVLKQLKYLRVRQLHAMMQAHFGPLGIEIGEHRLNVMLRQLRMASNFVFLKKDLITYGQREISEHYLEAIDVMLELTENTPIFYSQDRLWSPVFSFWRGRRNAWIAVQRHMAGHTRPHCRSAPHEGGTDHLDHRLRGYGQHQLAQTPFLCPPSAGRHTSLLWLFGV